MFQFPRVKFKNLLLLLLFLGALIGGIVLFNYTFKKQDQPDVILLSNILIFVFSTVMAAIISYLFSKNTNAEKIDTIAWASVEKMANLSVQMKQLNDFLNNSYKEILSDTNSIKDKNTIILFFKHKIIDISKLIQHLSSSNETLRSDWLGVVSYPTKEKIEKTYHRLNEYFGNWDFLNNSSGLNVKESKEITEIIDNMKTTEQELKFIPRVNLYSMVGPAVNVIQIRRTNLTGVLMIEVLRNTFIATGSGKIEPKLDTIPHITAKLISKPAKINERTFAYIPGCGTVFDFSITIKSTIYNKYLELGIYEFEYELVCS